MNAGLNPSANGCPRSRDSSQSCRRRTLSVGRRSARPRAMHLITMEASLLLPCSRSAKPGWRRLLSTAAAGQAPPPTQARHRLSTLAARSWLSEALGCYALIRLLIWRVLWSAAN